VDSHSERKDDNWRHSAGGGGDCSKACEIYLNLL
jgi:hypothetical protein